MSARKPFQEALSRMSATINSLSAERDDLRDRLAAALSALVIEHRKATQPAPAEMRYVGKYLRDAHTGSLMIWRTGAAGERPGYYPLADRDPMPGTPAEMAAMQADYAAMGVSA